MLRAIRDAEHEQRISETTERARRKADLLRGDRPVETKKQTETGFTNPVNEQKRAAIYEARTKQAKRDFRIP